MTLAQYIQNALDTLKIEFDITDPDQTIMGLAIAIGGANWSYAKQLGEVQKNVSPATAYSETEGGMLEVFGRFILGRNPLPATAGQWDVTVTGEAGGIITAGTLLRNSGNYLFQVQDEVVLTGATGTISVIALTAGIEGSVNEGATLFFTSPIALVDSEATVAMTTAEAVEAETMDEYSQKIVLAELAERQGGSAADYRIWSFDASGVVNTYPYVTETPNILNIYVEANTSDGVPTQTILDNVASVIEFDPDETKTNRGRRPMTCFKINYLQVIPVQIDVEFEGLKLNSDIANITSAITAYLSGIRPAVDGADDPNVNNSILSLGKMNCVAQNALSNGNNFDNLIMKVEGNAVTSYELLNGQIPVLNSVTEI